MAGYPLEMFRNEITKVPLEFNKEPSCTIDVKSALGRRLLKWVEYNFGEIDTKTMLRRLPAKVILNHFTFDEFCKLHYGQVISMDSSVEDLFKDETEYAIVQKIVNSMWHWGYGEGGWNEVVDAYNGIRNFCIPVADFDVKLDFTNGNNPKGYARESGTYLDGVFGFLIYYRGEHVLTVGFSFKKGYGLLVQQVQLAQRKGNRFLFRLPPNRMEFVLQQLAKAFSQHALYVADGGDICRVNIESYKYGLERVSKWVLREPSVRNLEEKAGFEANIKHLTAELPRLEAFYENTGQFVRGEEFVSNGIRHYRLKLRAPTKGSRQENTRIRNTCETTLAVSAL